MLISSFIRPSIRPVEYLPHEHLPQRVFQPTQRHQGPSRCGEDGHPSVTQCQLLEGARGGSHCVLARVLPSAVVAAVLVGVWLLLLLVAVL